MDWGSIAPASGDCSLEVERRWLEKAREDQEAFAWFHRRYYERIYWFVCGMVHDHDVADDLTAITFAQAYDNLSRYRWLDIPYVCYLHRIAANAVKSHWRRRRRRQRVALEAAGTLPDPRRTPLEDLARDDQNRRLHEEIEKLARPERVVISLYHWEGLKISEISRLLRVPQGTVQSRLSRARSKVRRGLQARENRPGKLSR